MCINTQKFNQSQYFQWLLCVCSLRFFVCLFLSIQFKFTLKISKIQLNLNINFKSVHIYQFQFDVELKTPLEIRYIYRPPKIDEKRQHSLTHTSTDKFYANAKFFRNEL